MRDRVLPLGTLRVPLAQVNDKYIDTNPRFLALDLAQQLRPGTFEHALHHLLDHSIDLSHFTTIAHFVSTLGEDIARVFAAVVAICDREGLIGREMFAIEGVKLPSNASKQRSGTRAAFARQATKLEAATP